MGENTLIDDLLSRRAVIGVIGLGYVGLPLAIAFANNGYKVVAYDVDTDKVRAVNASEQYIRHIPGDEMRIILDTGGSATADINDLAQADALLICVPTPLTRNREPDMRYVKNISRALAPVLRRNQLVVLESTAFPGTTREIVMPVLEQSGLRAGVDFHLAYSPEREDPGAHGHSARNIPKVVGGLTPGCLEAALTLYNAVVPQTVPVSSPETAEATKLLENIFRNVNIALVNELKQVFTRMGIDIWEVIEAAKSKPFGFMAFQPGPGLGGHCIPIDPFYLTWKAREYNCATRFIELAGEVNMAMPEYVSARTADALNRRKKCLNGSRLLLLGMAYKKDVDDIRESPALRLLSLFEQSGALVDYHDPHIPRLDAFAHGGPPMASVELNKDTLAAYDAVVLVTDHSDFDFQWIADHAELVIDTRNAFHSIDNARAEIIKA